MGSDERSAAPILEARNAGRRARDGEVWFLRDATLVVAAGERVMVRGPSGSGKTILLRALAMLDPLDAGEVLWRGSPVRADQVVAFRSQVVYLHQRPCLVEGSVEENLRFPLTFRVHRRRTFDAETVTRWLTLMGRDAQFLRKTTQNLSGGEGQLVALLRVMQLDPDILLLDEPTAALDQQATEAVEQLVLAWQREAPTRRSVVVVTHDAAQAGRLGGRDIRIEQGRIVNGQ